MIYEHDEYGVGLDRKSGLIGERGYSAFDDERDLERDSWWRTISASIALLRNANHAAEQSAMRIKALEERVSQLEVQLTKDELTGLMNRRGFYEAFEAELDRTERSHSKGGLLILIDLDNFKVINDTYGHQAGDAALRLVGKTLLADSRAMDSSARLGGDEFVLLLANTERDGALARAQNLIKRLNSLSLIWYGAEIPIRASLGLKTYAKGDDVETVFGDADSLLYREKRRNKGMMPDLMHSAF